MADWIWLNGEIIPFSEARIGVEDRGLQFADGVYEVIRLYRGKPFALDEHLARLERSAAGIHLSVPLDRANFSSQIVKLVDKSGVKDGMVYVQLTRGVAERNHAFATCAPTLLFYARALPSPIAPGEGEGVKLMSVPDERWRRCWIKSTALLANVLAKNEALSKGFDEAVFVENGLVSECSTSNLFAVIEEKLVTAPPGPRVLPGITRQIVIDCAAAMGIETDDRPPREQELLRASELFVTSTTREVAWVARYNDRYIGQGRCGNITSQLHREFLKRVRGS